MFKKHPVPHCGTGYYQYLITGGDMMIILLVFITGLMFGSFYNVIICRIPEGGSIVFPGSHCPKCQKKLGVLDLIPVLSWLFLKGKCRYCGERISIQYPLVELLTGLLFVLLYIKFGLTLKFIIFLLLVSVLLISSVIDLRYKIIPNKITYPSIVIGIMLAVFSNHISILASLLGILVSAGFLFLLALFYKGRGMGMGDVKLAAVIGAVLGWEFTILGIFIGSFVGAVVGVVLIYSGIIERKTRIPFGPLISLGVLISIFYGEEIINLILHIH